MPSVWADGGDSASQGLMHLRYAGGGGRGGGVQGSPRPVNALIGSQLQKAWITTKKRGYPWGGGGG